MPISHLNVFDEEPGEGVIKNYRQLGYICELLSRCTGRGGISDTYIKTVVKPAMEHRQLKFLFDADGIVVGCVVWATLAADVEYRFIRQINFELHHSEWNEGESLWVLDLVAPNGHLKYILAYLRDHLFRDYGRVRYCRFKNGKCMVREINRNDKISFFGRRGSGQ